MDEEVDVELCVVCGKPLCTKYLKLYTFDINTKTRYPDGGWYFCSFKCLRKFVKTPHIYILKELAESILTSWKNSTRK